MKTESEKVSQPMAIGEEAAGSPYGPKSFFPG